MLFRSLDWLPQGKRLVTVVTDCDLAGHLPGWPAVEGLALQPVDQAGLLDFYQRFGFRAWRKELEGALGLDLPVAAPVGTAAGGGAGAVVSVGAATQPLAAPGLPDNSGLARRYETIFDRERLADWLARLRAAPLAALDTETDSLDPMRARIVGISFAVQPGEAAYVPLRHDFPGVPDQLPLDEVLATLRPWLEDVACAKVGQNIKYDTHVLANHGIAVHGWLHDTLLQSYVFEAHLGHSLEKLADRHLHRKGLSYEELCGKGVNQISFSQVDIERATQYSGEDSEMTTCENEIWLTPLPHSSS